MRRYEPKILFNPTGREVEFMVNREIFTFKPGEKKPMDGFVAYQALNEVNTGLVEYMPDEHSEGAVVPEGGEIAYEEMPWRKLVSIASKEGIFKPGMGKDNVVKALKELDE